MTDEVLESIKAGKGLPSLHTSGKLETPEPEWNSMGIGKKLDDIVYQLKVLNETLRRKNNG